MPGTHSGKWATVDGQSTLRNWSIEDREQLARGLASNTRMMPVRKPGVRSWTGQLGYYGATPPANRMPGNLFALEAYGAPDDDASGVGQLYTGNAMIDQIVQTWSWRDGQMLSGQMNFSGDLALAYSTGADPGDATDPDMPPVCGLIVEIDTGSGGYVEVPNLVQAQLTISAANQGFVNSSTYVSGECWTGRRSGPYDAMLSLSQEDNRRVANVLQMADEVAVKLWTSDTEFWELLWMRVSGFSGISADRESGAILAQTISLEFTGFGGVGSGSLGEVNLPGGTNWWPGA